MRALPRHSRVRNSTSQFEASVTSESSVDDRFAPKELSSSDDLCPLKLAMRDELLTLGAGVSQIQQYLHSGDLGNAEDAFVSIMERLREKFCPANPSMCDWVREGNHGTGCDFLSHSETPYLHSISVRSAEKTEPADSSSSMLDDLVEQAMRF